AGVKDFEAISIFGLYGQKNIPVGVLEQISNDVRNVLQSADIKEKFAALGATPGNLPQPQFDAYVNKEIDKWSEVIQQANITLPK
ncbi:MAG: tripartite tricarboxylate transporter substrate binding protein, partial [Advenella sp.]